MQERRRQGQCSDLELWTTGAGAELEQRPGESAGGAVGGGDGNGEEAGAESGRGRGGGGGSRWISARPPPHGGGTAKDTGRRRPEGSGCVSIYEGAASWLPAAPASI